MTNPLRIDAHQHFWDPARNDYGWLTADLPTLFKSYQPADLQPLLHSHHINGTVLVQAAPTVAETDYLLDLACAASCVKGVVGWIDFENTSHITHLHRWTTTPLLKSIRPMVQDIKDPDWLLKPEIDWAFDALQQLDLAFDALVLPIHLPRLLKRLQHHPALRVCIDHAAKPDIAGGHFEPWASEMTKLANETSAVCKISGLVTEAAPDWAARDILPYLEHLLKIFGPDRLIFGSDWPVLTLNGSYESWIALIENWSQSWAPVDRANLFGGNAIRFYHL